MGREKARRTRILKVLKRFVRGVERDPSLWSRQADGRLPVLGSGWFRMQDLVEHLFTGRVSRDASSTIPLETEVWQKLSAHARTLAAERSLFDNPSLRDPDFDVEDVVDLVAGAAQRRIVREGARTILSGYLKGKPMNDKSWRDHAGVLEVSLGADGWTTVQAVCDGLNEQLGLKDYEGWEPSSLTRAFLLDDAFVRSVVSAEIKTVRRQRALQRKPHPSTQPVPRATT